MKSPKVPEGKRVIDAAPEQPSGARLARVVVVLLAIAAGLGVALGFFTTGALWCADHLQELLWAKAEVALGWWAPLALCTAGGLCVGVATVRLGCTLDTLGQVIARCRAQGGYALPASVPKVLLLFLLPIAFGGAIGPEAGVSGLVVALASRAVHAMRRSGVAAVRDADHPLAAALSVIAPGNSTPDARYERVPGAVLWGVGGAGFVVGARLFSLAFGPAGSLPRFDAIDYGTLDAATVRVALVGVAVGCVLALFSAKSDALLARVTTRPTDASPRRAVAQAVLCGIALGTVACALPNVLFSGQVATRELAGGWREAAAGVLAATALAKLVLSNACVRTGWVGGQFFPLIFCGVSAGFALAAVAGVDPRLPVALTCAALVSGATGKWLLTTLVLALCFPPASLPAVAASAFVATRVAAAAHAHAERRQRA